MRRFVGVCALSSAVFLSLGLALAAEPPATGNAPSTTTAPPAAKKTLKPTKAAKVTAPKKPKVAKTKTPKPVIAPHNAKKKVGQTTPSAPSATPATSAAGSTQR